MLLTGNALEPKIGSNGANILREIAKVLALPNIVLVVRVEKGLLSMVGLDGTSGIQVIMERHYEYACTSRTNDIKAVTRVDFNER